MDSENSNAAFRQFLSQDMLDVLVRVGLIAVMVVLCFRIFAPFMNLLLWGLILAIALHPLQQKLAARVGGNEGRAASLLILLALLLIGTPTVLLGSAFAGQIHETFQAFSAGSVHISTPKPAVAEWPIVGKQVYAAWSAAAADLPAYLESLQPQLGQISQKALAAAASTMGNVFFFLGALIIAGIMMAYGASGQGATERILTRLTGPENGPRLHVLIIATIRSVATGVIGVAFIQALLLGIGFLLAGIPFAGLLALIVMIFGILQLPAAVISLPAIAFLWWQGDASVVHNVIWSVYLLIAGLADNVLKPLLLGRGVEAPMPIILMGALGGMMASGIVGLFTGAVVLAVGYKLFMDWVNQPGSGSADTDDSGAGRAEASSSSV